MKLAIIPFANSAPFFHNLDPAWSARQTMLPDAPRDLGDLARQNQVDAGLFSLVDVWDLEKKDLFECLGNMGIAGHGPIRSILLFGVKDPASLEGKRIAVTGQTATTVRLMEIWLRQRVGIKAWQLVPLGQPAEATLLIGDQAISRSLSLSSLEPLPIDLCEEWSRWTSQSFVFARWAVRKTLPDKEKNELASNLEFSLDQSLSTNGIASLAAALSAQTGFPSPFLQEYLAGIIYRFGFREEKGMELFKEKLEKLSQGA